MAKLRELKNFEEDYWNEKHYNIDDDEELRDNILFILEQLEEGKFDNSDEAFIGLLDMFRNYYGDTVLRVLG